MNDREYCPKKYCNQFSSDSYPVHNLWFSACFFTLLFSSISVLGCPVARKRRLEETETDQEQERPASKRKSYPLKLALDEGFSAESDASSEAEGEVEKDGEKEGEAKEVEQEEQLDVDQKKEEEDKMIVEAAEEKEEMAESFVQDGQTNGEEVEVLSPQFEDQETKGKDAYHDDKTAYTTDKGEPLPHFTPLLQLWVLVCYLENILSFGQGSPMRGASCS